MWQSSLPLIKNNRASRPANGPSTQAPLARHGRSATITAVVNALAKAGIELGENGSIFPRPKRKAR
jgi:hypothetical protein